MKIERRILTILGLNGGSTLSSSSSCQWISLKKECDNIALSPPCASMQPRRLLGFFVMNCIRKRTVSILNQITGNILRCLRMVTSVSNYSLVYCLIPNFVMCILMREGMCLIRVLTLSYLRKYSLISKMNVSSNIPMYSA